MLIKYYYTAFQLLEIPFITCMVNNPVVMYLIDFSTQVLKEPNVVH